MKELEDCNVEKARRRSRDSLCLLVAISQSSTVCAGGKSQGGGGLLFSRVGRKVIVLCFPLPKLQTLIVNIKGPA